MRSYVVLALVALLAFGLGWSLSYIHTFQWVKSVVLTIRPVRENNQKYPLVYPLLYYDFGDAKQFFEDHTLDAKLDDDIRTQYADGNAQSISVSFRNFSNTTWAADNQDVQYRPGSMLKVLIMLAYFKEAELDPTILQRYLPYTQDIDRQTNALAFALPTSLKVGNSYTIDDLIKTMIADSDNGAETLLLNSVDRPTLNSAYVDLGIPSPDAVQGEYTISAAQYISFLRILYNSTYLNEKYSEEALSLMSQSSYHDGISAGVPAGITVAQKYGERIDASGTTVQAIELHDCGIVYAPNASYALCVMTKGNDATKLTSVIKDISSLIYGYVTGK